MQKFIITNGSQAVTKSVFNFVELACIFPITPSTEVSWGVRNKSYAGEKNIFGFVPEIFQYNSELGSIAGVHGALENGILATTFSGSQGLLLMLPNIYKCCGEFLPCVIQVASRSVAKRSLSIHGDNSDIYAVRQAGPILLSSSSVQDAHLKAALAYGIAIEASYPVIHFYDSEIANTIRKIAPVSEDFYQTILSKKHLDEFRKTRMNPMNPTVRGGHENQDTFFQSQESQNLKIANLKPVIKKYLRKLAKYTNSDYAPFTYYGSPVATDIIVAMGSVIGTIKETIDDLKTKGRNNLGVIIVHVYRPFYTDDLVKTIPKSVKRIAVISKTKEVGATGEPLFVDVISALARHKVVMECICNGRYGLSAKNTIPADIKAIYDNLDSKNPKIDFTVSINDDLTFLSLPRDNNYKTEKEEATKGVLFYGLGGDGTISSANLVGRILGTYSDNFLQIDKVHNSLKANNVTQSILQISSKEMNSMYLINEFFIILSSMDTYLPRFNMVERIKQNGVFLLNTTINPDHVSLIMPNKYKKILAERNCKFYTFNATDIAKDCGIPKKTSMIIAALVLFTFANLKLLDKTAAELEEILYANITKMFSRKGESVVNANINSVKMLNTSKELGIHEVKVDPKWKEIKLLRKPVVTDQYNQFVIDIENTLGENVPVSSFQEKGGFCNCSGGVKVNNSTFKSKKRINAETPRWIPEKCIQCNRCALVCPHATIRAFLLDDQEIKNAPQKFETLYAVGAEGFRFRIQIDTENCVGCALCVETCPVGALVMVPAKEEHGKYTDLTEYIYKQTKPKSSIFSTDMAKGATLLYPYFEGSGACAGCGETPYYRLLTQLFGKEMIIANATGCSSIYGGHLQSPFATDSDGHGPAWANSLYEDGAEFGLGMRLAEQYKQRLIHSIINVEINNVVPELKKLLLKWQEIYPVSSKRFEQRKLRLELTELIKSSDNQNIKKLLDYEDSLVKKSMWIIGGDGWAYDIDFGGIRHALDSGANINIMVLDTETFSNTGGQIGSGSAYPAGGKGNQYSALRTEIGQMLITHKNAYVAQTAMGMNPNQTIRALKDAESYDGPSIVICYCPCISHGFDLVKHQLNERDAVLSGYWPIFRFDPRLLEKKENPLLIDFKKPKFELISKFLRPQLRFYNEYKKYHEIEIKKINLFTNYLRRNFEGLIHFSELKFTDNVDYSEAIRDVFSQPAQQYRR